MCLSFASGFILVIDFVMKCLLLTILFGLIYLLNISKLSVICKGADLAQCPSCRCLSLFKIKIIHHEGHEENEGKRIVILKCNGSL